MLVQFYYGELRWVCIIYNRAREVSEAYKFLYDIQIHQNYRVLVEQLQDRLNTSKHGSAGSMLHNMIREALKVYSNIISTSQNDLDEDIHTYNKNNHGFFSGTTASRLAMLHAQLTQNQQQTRDAMEAKDQQHQAERLKDKEDADAKELARQIEADKKEQKRQMDADIRMAQMDALFKGNQKAVPQAAEAQPPSASM